MLLCAIFGSCTCTLTFVRKRSKLTHTGFPQSIHVKLSKVMKRVCTISLTSWHCRSCKAATHWCCCAMWFHQLFIEEMRDMACHIWSDGRIWIWLNLGVAFDRTLRWWFTNYSAQTDILRALHIKLSEVMKRICKLFLTSLYCHSCEAATRNLGTPSFVAGTNSCYDATLLKHDQPMNAI